MKIIIAILVVMAVFSAVIVCACCRAAGWTERTGMDEKRTPVRNMHQSEL